MGILIFTARVGQLMHERLEYEYKLSNIVNKLSDLNRYAAMVGGGGIGLPELLSSPATMMGRGLAYLSYAHNSATQYVSQNAPGMFQMYNQSGQHSAEEQAMMQNYIINQLYAQARDQAARVEERNLNAEEGKLKAEKAKIETKLQEINAELQTTRQARDKEIQESAPRYVAQG